MVMLVDVSIMTFSHSLVKVVMINGKKKVNYAIKRNKKD